MLALLHFCYSCCDFFFVAVMAAAASATAMCGLVFLGTCVKGVKQGAGGSLRRE